MVFLMNENDLSSVELSLKDSSNKRSQHMLLGRNIENYPSKRFSYEYCMPLPMSPLNLYFRCIYTDMGCNPDATFKRNYRDGSCLSRAFLRRIFSCVF